MPPPNDLAIVAIDDDSYQVIGLDSTLPWPRGLHAELIRTLKREGARAVAFDVLFLDQGAAALQRREDFPEQRWVSSASLEKNLGPFID